MYLNWNYYLPIIVAIYRDNNFNTHVQMKDKDWTMFSNLKLSTYLDYKLAGLHFKHLELK